MKNFNFEKFIEPYKERLEWSGKSRLLYYEYVINKLVNLDRPILVVETGTMWSELEDNMGAFTLVFGDLISNWTGGKLITIDISEKNIEKCKEVTKEFSNSIEYVTSDSINYLESLDDNVVNKIDLLYLDSYDLAIPDPIPSQLHHYRELAAVYKRLKLDVYLAVDDNFLPGNWVEWWTMDKEGNIVNKTKYDVGIYRILGKGTLIDHFLLTNGWQRKDDWLYLGGSQLLSYERI